MAIFTLKFGQVLKVGNDERGFIFFFCVIQANMELLAKMCSKHTQGNLQLSVLRHCTPSFLIWEYAKKNRPFSNSGLEHATIIFFGHWNWNIKVQESNNFSAGIIGWSRSNELAQVLFNLHFSFLCAEAGYQKADFSIVVVVVVVVVVAVVVVGGGGGGGGGGGVFFFFGPLGLLVAFSSL